MHGNEMMVDLVERVGLRNCRCSNHHAMANVHVNASVYFWSLGPNWTSTQC